MSLLLLNVGLGVDKDDFIVSVQPFAISITGTNVTGTATLSRAVETVNSIILFNECNTNVNDGLTLGYCTLTNPTTVTATRTLSVTATSNIIGTVVEFNDQYIASSVQYGTITVGALSATGTATISSVNASNAIAIYLGATSSLTDTSAADFLCAVDLTNGTTVTATRGNASATNAMTVGFCVIEFGSGIIQSIQKRAVTSTSTSTTLTDTVTAVTVANTLLIHNGQFINNTLINGAYYLTSASTTTNTLTRGGSGSLTRTIKYVALEFVSGVITAMQTGTTALTGASSATSALSPSVDLTRSICLQNGFDTNNSTVSQGFATARLSDASTVTAEKGSATNNAAVAWQVVTFG